MSHLVSTAATEDTCHRCRRPVLVALAEGLPTKVDPAPLDHAGEIAALIQGRWTYTLTRTRDLIHRDADRIGTLAGTIHTQHICPRRSR